MSNRETSETTLHVVDIPLFGWMRYTVEYTCGPYLVGIPMIIVASI